MKLTKLRNRLGRLILALLAVLLMATPSFAALYELRADTATVIMPDGVSIPVWGFADDTAGPGAVTVPGPMLEVLPGDTTLTINLTNNLPVPVSIVIPGQPAQLTPVPGPDGRIVSFTSQVAVGGTGSFTWNNMKPGTYIYHSGSNPALQVHMGLYGGVKVVPEVGSAYTGVPYDAEVVIFYSELDPVLHNTQDPAQPLTYDPAYFLVNGMPFPGTPALNPVNTNQRVLIRFLNAGLKNHVPTLQGGYWTVIAEDGNLYPYPKEQYSVFLPAIKTMDVIWTPEMLGTYPVYDRTHHLTNGGVGGGGMLAYLQVGTAVTPLVTIVTPSSGASFVVGDTITFTGSADDPQDGDISADLAWESSIDGPIGTGATFDIDTLSEGTHTITASVTDTDGNTGTASITIEVMPPPAAPSVIIEAPADGTTVDEGTAVTFTGSATDVQDGVISASLAWESSIDGSIGTGATFDINTLSEGTHTITASVTDTDGNTGTASITVTVNPLVPAVTITAPADGTTVDEGTAVTFTGTAIDAPDGDISADLAWESTIDGPIGTGATFDVVLSPGTHTITASVTDSHGNTGTASITVTVNPLPPVVTITEPADGTEVDEGATVVFTGTANDAEDGDISADLSWESSIDGPIGTGATFDTSNLSPGTHTITASVTDSRGLSGSDAMTLTVIHTNQPPVAVQDDAQAQIFGTTFINLVANDYDPDGTIDPNSIVLVTQPPSWANLEVVTGGVTVRPYLLGTISFAYTVKDTEGATSNVAEVELEVQSMWLR